MNNTSSTLVAHCGAHKVNREELMEIPVPKGTKTHQPLSHYQIVQVLEEALTFRYLEVVKEEFAVSQDGMKMFGIMELNAEFSGCRFSIGLRNSNDKSMRLALTIGYRVFVCDNMAFSGDFTPLMHKHTNNLHLQDAVSVAVDRMHRGFEPLKRKVQQMRETTLSEQTVKLLIYEAFLDRKLKGVPRHLMPIVHDHYFNPQHEAFQPRNLWSLSNAFTSAFKKLTPVKQFEITARLGSFLTDVQDKMSGARGAISLPAEMGKILPFGQTRPVAMTVGDNISDDSSESDQETSANYPFVDIHDVSDGEDIDPLQKMEEEMEEEYLEKYLN
jgi:hypothetical protein